MTPEQEILEDALALMRRRIDRFSRELHSHMHVFPLSPSTSWDDLDDDTLMHVAAFTKRFELTQDQIVRKLFRSVLAVEGVKTRTKALGDVIEGVAKLGIADHARWNEITKLRNTLAHDYSMTPETFTPSLNAAWASANELIEMVTTVEHYVAAHDLLPNKGDNDD